MEMPSALLGTFVNGASLVCIPGFIPLIYRSNSNQPVVYELYHTLQGEVLRTAFYSSRNSTSFQQPFIMCPSEREFQVLPAELTGFPQQKCAVAPCVRSDARHSTAAKL